MEEHSAVPCQKPQPRHWMTHPMGKSGIHLSSVASMWDSVTGTSHPELRVELVLKGDHTKQNFSVLEKGKSEIEKAIGEKLTWHNPDKAKMCRVYMRTNANFLDQKLCKQQHEWLRTKLEIFHKVFSPLVKSFE